MIATDSLADSSLENKYCLITGATSGIGRAAAKALAERGARLTVLCRNRDKGEEVLAELPGAQPHALLLCDFSSLASVREAAQQYLATNKPLHLLVNNAGVVNTKRKLSADGFEEMFAVNHLAPFLLTNMLLLRLRESAPARIVNVASDAYTFVRDMGFDDLAAERNYKTFKVYGRSKLGNILTTQELSRRLQDTGVTVNALHPGAVSTSLGVQDNPLLGRALSILMKPFFRTPEKGAETAVYLSASPALDGISGGYYYNCRPHPLKPWGRDEQAAKRLWDLSCQLTGLPSH